MDAKSITQNDILDALRQAMVFPPTGDGFTVVELAQALGCTPRKGSLAMTRLLASGEVEVVMIRRQKITGVWHTIPGFRLKASVARPETKLA